MKYIKNLEFFNKIDTEIKAYFLGLLYADGYVRNNGFGIQLHEKDKYILEKLSMEIIGVINLYEKPPYEFVWKSTGKTVKAGRSYTLMVYDKTIKSQLVNLGCTQRKSLTLRFPTTDQVPLHLIHHFIRGYFDGDGSISSSLWGGFLRYAIQIVSSQYFCDSLKKIVKDNTGCTLVDCPKQSKIFGVYMRGNNQILRFMNWVYKDATIFLHRKKQKFDHLVIKQSLIPENHSKFNNVSFDKTRNKWVCSIRINGISVRVGRFVTEQKALDKQREMITLLEMETNKDDLPLEYIKKLARKVELSARESVLIQPRD